MVSALVSARRGSGFSRPSSKRIMKSTHASGRSLSAATIGALSSAASPNERRMWVTSAAPAAGLAPVSASSRARSMV